MKIRLKVYGCRGSVPVEGEEFKVYGGATSCMCLICEGMDEGKVSKEEIYLDAGSGIVSAKAEEDSNISILITHMHLDHVMGLTFFPALSQKGRKIDIYAEKRSGLEVGEAIDRLFTPPYWPLKVTDYPSNARYHKLEKSFSLGQVEVDTLEVNHPGGSTTYKLSFGGKTIVYATDYEHDDNKTEELVQFSKNCDLLVYDGQYSWEEYPGCYGFGHSIPEVGLEVAKSAGAKSIMFTHHSPGHNDDYMAKWEEKIKGLCPTSFFAKAGMELMIL